jgi:UDP-N-acetylmuramate dehydrogenase
MSGTGALERAEAILREACGDRLRVGLTMAPLTTFRLGGPAALYLEPESEADLAAAGRAVIETSIPFLVIGKGSNLLVSDRGFPGLVLRLGRGYRWAARDGDRLTSGAAMPLPALAGVALHQGLAGLEFGVAIPATLGGAVRMNAGAHEGSMAEVLAAIEVFRLREGRTQTLDPQEVAFAYRRSDLPEDAVVTGATLALHPEEAGAIRVRMDAARAWRRTTQPLAEPNCGSVFKNPEGDHAARLIEAAGLKGLGVGGAHVSSKHANFIVAGPDARARDVLALIEQVQAKVEAASGVRLEPEVHLVGEFDDAA